MKAWHFVGETLRDGRPIPANGEWLEHEGEIKICSSGLHASKCAFDALKYAPGNTLCRVVVDGVEDEHDDKLVARRRKILWRIDAEEILREAARMYALDVIHLWDAPDVVRQYLETGDKSLRDAARTAACDAARTAACDAAWDAACDAAWDAACDAARTAARDAAWDAARAATWAATWSATWDAAVAKQRQAIRNLIARELRKQRALRLVG